MKNKLIASIVCLLIYGCDLQSQYEVRTLNGSIVVAIDIKNKSIKKGDTVCVSRNIDRDDWYIDNRAIMKDTTFVTRDCSSCSSYIIESKIGIIQNDRSKTN